MKKLRELNSIFTELGFPEAASLQIGHPPYQAAKETQQGTIVIVAAQKVSRDNTVEYTLYEKVEGNQYRKLSSLNDKAMHFYSTLSHDQRLWLKQTRLKSIELIDIIASANLGKEVDAVATEIRRLISTLPACLLRDLQKQG